MKYQPPFDPAHLDPVDGIYNSDAAAEYVNGDPRIGREGSIPPMEALAHPMKELVKLLTSAGITPSHAVLEQVAEAAARYASLGIFGADTGTENTFVVAAMAGVVPPKALIKGLRLKFYPAHGSTGASTVNAFGLGAKPLYTPAGAALSGGEVVTGRLTEMDYDPTLNSGGGVWRLTPWADRNSFSLPADALGFLHNDGFGSLAWIDLDNLNLQEITGASGNITLDGSYDGIDISMVGNITLYAVTNMRKNKPFFLRFRQDSTGGRTVTINSSIIKIGAIAVSASSTGNAIDVMGVMMRTTAVGEVVMWNRGVQ